MLVRVFCRFSTAVTRGIQVVASAVQAHECGMNIYSLRVRLLLPGEDGYALAFTRYCHGQYCVVYIATTGGRGETVNCAIEWAMTGEVGCLNKGWVCKE